MTEGFLTSVVTVFMALIGIAILAVILSPKAQTAQVIQAGTSGFSSVLGAALSPVTGGGLGIPGFGGTGFTG
jgi:hypothetical protein